MKKSDLKTGMVAELRDGSLNVLMIDCVFEDAMIDLETRHHYLPLESINEDMKSITNESLDVVKVYICGVNFCLDPERKKDLIWERKEESALCTIDGVEYSESTLRSLIQKATQ